LKLPNAAPVAAPAPAEPISEPADDAGFGGFGGDEEPAPSNDKPSSDKPFGDEPFDAGVEADEETDPKRFIEQLTGKLGQSLRKYNEEQGKPDFELEKFVVNSVLSATHTSEMDEEDRKDIIKKVNTAGSNDKNDSKDSSSDNDSNDADNSGDNDEFGGDMGDGGFGTEEDLEETVFENFFLDKPKKNEMFQDGSNDFLYEDGGCWDIAERVPGTEKGDKGSCRLKKLEENHENIEGGESLNYMFWQNLKTINHASGELLEMNQQEIDEMCANGHAWAVDHISTSSDDIEEVYHFFEANIGEYDGETEGGYEDEYGSVSNINLNEAKYKGKKVKLGKPSKGDVKNKKFKVYVKNKKGNVVKVNFGDANMEIKRDNPKNKKSFRARHKCSQAKDRTTPKYWSCKMWSSTPVSKIVGEDLQESEKISTFDKNYLKNRINETFNQEENMQELMMEPQVMPNPSEVKPIEVKPSKEQPIDPSRRNKPFLPNIKEGIKPDPKAINESKFNYEVYHKTLASCFDEAENYVIKRGYDPIEFELSDPQHVAYGQTQRYNKELTVNGKLQRKGFHIQVYRMDSGNYELNMYIN
jgi:hypothetical protein